MKWSDGVPINSSDLAYSYGIYLTTGPYANLSAVDVWGNVQGTVSNITIVNSTAIMLQTAAPDSLFWYLTWLYQIYPWHYYKQFTGNNILGTTSILRQPGRYRLHSIKLHWNRKFDDPSSQSVLA